MDWKEIGFVLLISIIGFAGVFARPVLFAYDSYAFASFNQGLIASYGFHPAADALASFIPPFYLAYLLIMWFCFAASLLAIYFALKRLYPEGNLWRTVFLVVLGGAPILLFDFAQFQNELFAYPLIFWSFYFLVAKKEVPGLLLALAASLFWLGGMVWVGVVAFAFFPFFAVALILGLGFFWDRVISSVAPIDGVMFNTPFYGLIDFFLLLPAVATFFLTKNRWWLLSGAVCLLILCFSARYVILFVPFLLFGIGELVKILERKGFDQKTLCYTAFFLLICWNVALFMQHPTQGEMVLASEFVETCKTTQNLCINDWSLGWWITYNGGVTNYKSGPPSPDYANELRPYYALTQESLGCKLIRKEGLIKLYWCN